MSFAIIAAVGKNNELGKKGGLCFDIPGDLKFFKQTTIGHPVFMGLNTWRSLPRKLPGRQHYILTFNAADVPSDPDLHPVTDLDAFIKKWQASDEVMFVIGGGMVYQQLLEYADKLYLTEVDAYDTEAEVFFPQFDKHKFHKEIIGKGADNDLVYQHALYTRK